MLFELLLREKKEKSPLSDTTPLTPLQLHVFISFLLHPSRHVRGMFPSPLCCRTRGFKGTTEQIRGPSQCTDGLSLISDGRLKGESPPSGASVGDQGGPSVAPGPPSVFPLRGSWTVTRTKHRGPAATASVPRSACLVRASRRKSPESFACIPLLAQGRV